MTPEDTQQRESSTPIPADPTERLTSTALPTVAAPSLPPGACGSGSETNWRAGELLAVGETLDDFTIEAILGRGAFGVVYAARQRSLDRRVALKVTANRGSEGRTMARLDHPHVVRVYSESVDATRTRRLLCMQLVAGATLAALIGDLHRQGPRVDWSGADLLAALDARTTIGQPLHPTSLRDRDRLAQSDAVEAVGLLGARLAEALDFAHSQGVLHRDIKPANILVNQYGQPLLADFNISLPTFDADLAAAQGLGGTVAYMAPEHLHAFDSHEPETVTVGPAADIYSLGLVLWQLWQGHLPLSEVDPQATAETAVKQLAALRAVATLPIPQGPCTAAKSLAYAIARCLSPEPHLRFASGGDLAIELQAIASLAKRERAPRPAGGRKWLFDRPFAAIALAALGPQAVASVVNIVYNLQQIVTRLDDAQRALFYQLVTGYNLVVYPLAVMVGTMILLPLARDWELLCGSQPVPASVAVSIRQRVRCLPRWLLLLVAIGWLPGAWLFPWLLDRLRGPIDWQVYGHFACSFTLSGLIGLAYSLVGLLHITVVSMYARSWPVAANFRAQATNDLGCARSQFDVVKVLAGAIPLLAAALLIVVGDSGSLTFRVLTLALILLGAVGFQYAAKLTAGMASFIDRWCGP